MDHGLKRRLVGAAVLVGFAVIFIPMLLDDSGRSGNGRLETNIPPKPEGGFSSRVVPLSDFESTLPAGKGDAPRRPAASPAPVAGKGGWVVQVGSFSSRTNADARRRKLAGKGFKAWVEPVDGLDGKVFRVRVGPELARASADALRARVAGELGIEAIVVAYP